jgi:hypothetical protein
MPSKVKQLLAQKLWTHQIIIFERLRQRQQTLTLFFNPLLEEG